VKALPATFYARPTVSVARRLLGTILVSDIAGRRTAGRIVEVEAYVGPDDPACHAYGGRRTRRVEVMYGPPGFAYVYFTYGMHWCLNVVTGAPGFPAAVLIRALQPLAGVATMRRRRGPVADVALCAGPARLCQALGITGKENGASLKAGRLRIQRDQTASRLRVAVSGRVGVSAGADLPLRFCVAGSPWLSR
jgi:DNA-3-methyladenine glycosylase